MASSLLTRIFLLSSMATIIQSNACFTLNAAFHLKNKLILTYGSNYFALHNRNKIVSKGDLKLPFEPEAALSCRSCDNDKPGLFFKGSFYFKFTQQGLENGPYQSETLHPFLKNGVDAAAKFGRMSYFFKGCQFLKMTFLDLEPPEAKQYYNYVNMLSDILGPSTKGYLPSVGLPCNIGAAWEDDQHMVIIKGKKAYIWRGSNTISMPINLSSILGDKFINLCSSSNETIADGFTTTTQKTTNSYKPTTTTSTDTVNRNTEIISNLSTTQTIPTTRTSESTPIYPTTRASESYSTDMNTSTSQNTTFSQWRFSTQPPIQSNSTSLNETDLLSKLLNTMETVLSFTKNFTNDNQQPLEA